MDDHGSTGSRNGGEGTTDSLAGRRGEFVEVRREVNRRYRECLLDTAKRLEGPLNAYLRTLPCASQAEIAVICTFTNRLLKEVGLECICPKTGRAGILVCEAGKGRKPRFRLEVRQDDGTRAASFWSSGLPVLRIGPAEQGPDDRRRPHLMRVRSR